MMYPIVTGPSSESDVPRGPNHRQETREEADDLYSDDLGAGPRSLPLACSALDMLVLGRAMRAPGPENTHLSVPFLPDGAIRFGAVTALCGAACSGKTQVLHSVALRAAALGHPVTWVDTSGSLSVNRLAEMAAATLGSWPARDALARITVSEALAGPSDLVDALCALEHPALSLRRTAARDDRAGARSRVVIVDSVNAALSGVVGSNAGAAWVKLAGRALRTLSRRTGAAVVVANGAHAVPAHQHRSPGPALARPLLGIPWARVPDRRIVISSLSGASIVGVPADTSHSHPPCANGAADAEETRVVRECTVVYDNLTPDLTGQSTRIAITTAGATITPDSGGP